MIFDTHIHLNDEKILLNIDEYINNAMTKGVAKFLCVGFDLKSSELAVHLANKYKNVYAAVGIIPTEHLQYNENSLILLKKIALSSNKVVAIGEIGLDYYWENEENIKSKQKKMFIDQINLANELELPISIHCRDAYQDTFNILKEHDAINKGIMHCYSGSLEMGKEFIKLGYYLAFGGTLTFKNNSKTRNVLENVPLNKVVFETDAPYLAPHPYRGRVNIPEYIVETINFAANVLNISKEKLETISFGNSLKVLKING